MDPKEYFRSINSKFPSLILGGMHIPSDMKGVEADFRRHMGHFVIKVDEPSELWSNPYGVGIADVAVNKATIFPTVEDAMVTVPHIKEGAVLYPNTVGFSDPGVEPVVCEIDEAFIAQYLLNPPPTNKGLFHRWS